MLPSLPPTASTVAHESEAFKCGRQEFSRTLSAWGLGEGEDLWRGVFHRTASRALQDRNLPAECQPGTYLADSESEATWSDIFKDLKGRGLHVRSGPPTVRANVPARKARARSSGG